MTRNRIFVRKLIPDHRTLPVTPPMIQEPAYPMAQKTPENPLEDFHVSVPDLSRIAPQPLPAERAPDIARPDEVGDVSEEQHHHDQDEVVIDTHDAEDQPRHQEEQVDVTLPRPRRNIKPNLKYSPEVYDLNYVGIKLRLRSRRSIQRTET